MTDETPATVSAVYAGSLFFVVGAAPVVLAAWAAWAPTLPTSTSTSVSLDPLPSSPDGVRCVRVRYASTDDPVRAAELVAPMRRVVPPLLDTVARCS